MYPSTPPHVNILLDVLSRRRIKGQDPIAWIELERYASRYGESGSLRCSQSIGHLAALANICGERGH